MSDLKGKVAVVTGASKGIGAGIAEDLAARGVSVVVNYGSSKAEAEAVLGRIKKNGGKAIAVQADISKVADLGRLFAETQKAFGKVDILVNNAGIFEFKSLADIDEQHFDKQFNTNVKGLLFATQQAAKAFGENGGVVVNISSVISNSPKANASVYGATKAAVDSVTKSLAAELGPKKIRVNSVLPGVTETEGFIAMENHEYFKETFVPQTPLGRIGTAGDIAKAVAFLASDEASWITGETLASSGGLQ